MTRRLREIVHAVRLGDRPSSRPRAAFQDRRPRAGSPLLRPGAARCGSDSSSSVPSLSRCAPRMPVTLPRVAADLRARAREPRRDRPDGETTRPCRNRNRARWFAGLRAASAAGVGGGRRIRREREPPAARTRRPRIEVDRVAVVGRQQRVAVRVALGHHREPHGREHDAAADPRRVRTRRLRRARGGPASAVGPRRSRRSES